MSLLKNISKAKTSKFLIEKRRERKFLDTKIFPINLLISADPTKGPEYGSLGMISAESATGKSSVGFSLMASAQKAGMDVIFIDAETTYNAKTAEAFGIDVDAENFVVLQSNVIEHISQFVAETLDIDGGSVKVEDRENVFILLDSWGALISTRALDAAEEGKGLTMDIQGKLSMAKNQLANMLRGSKATIFVVNHLGKPMSQYEPNVIPGGNKIYYMSDYVLECTSSGAKDKDKDGNILGKIIPFQVRKGRKTKEFTKAKFNIMHDSGISPYFGLLDLAVEYGIITEGKADRGAKGYSRIKLFPDDPILREELIYTANFWVPIVKDEGFKTWLREKISFDESLANMLLAKDIYAETTEQIDEETGEVTEVPKEKSKKGGKKK